MVPRILQRAMTTTVMKFGGSALGMTMGLTQMLSIVLHECELHSRLLIVVSALDGVTDQLIEATRLAELSQRRGFRRIVATLRQRHLSLIEHLPLGQTDRSALHADIDRLLFDMLDNCESLSEHPASATERDALTDAIVGVGERLAARITAALIRARGLRAVAIDTTDLIITDGVFGHATPNFHLTRDRLQAQLTPLLERQIIPVITGFIGSTQSGRPTTLGRGGSDLTASLVAASIHVDEVCVWTDVDGLMSADPREIADAHVIPELSYEETTELAYFGARLLHEKMVDPLRVNNIPLHIRNIFKPHAPGTIIHDRPQASSRAIKAVTSIMGLVCRSDQRAPLHAVAALVDKALFDLTGTRTDIVITLQSPGTSLAAFVVPMSAGPDALHNLHNRVASALPAAGLSNWTVGQVAVVTVVGAGIGDDPVTLGRIIAALRGIPILGMRGGSGAFGLSVLVDPVNAEQALSQLHALTRTDN